MTEATIKSYDIGGKTFELRPLVFGQWQQLNRIMDGVDLPAELSMRNLVAAFADQLHLVLAVILTEKNRSPRDKNLDELAEQLAFNMPPEQVAEVVGDFFTQAPLASVFDLVTGVVERISQRIAPALPGATTGSSKPCSSSATATGPSGEPSSGDAPPPK